MKTRNTILMSVFLAFSVIFLMSFASAALVIDVTSIPSSVNHDAGTVQVLFTLRNTDNFAHTGITWTQSTTNIGRWSNLPVLTSIEAGANVPLSATLTFPPNSSGTIAAELKAQSTAGQVSRALAIPITNSAALDITPATQTIKSGQSLTVDVKNIGNTNLNNIVLSSSGEFTVTLSKTTFALAPGATEKVTVTAASGENLKFGLNTVTLTARDTTQNVQDTATLTQRSTFCRNGSVGGNLEITDLEIDNQGDGDDDSWQFLDVIEVTVTVENNGNDDEFGQNTEVHLGLFDSTGKNQISDLEFENTDEEKIELGDLDEGDDDDAVFTFKVPADVEDGTYKLAVKAFSDDLGEDEECTDESDDDFFQEVKIEREDDEGKFIAFDNVEIRPTEEVTCGDSVTINAEVFNIGDEDQDQVRINLRNTELNLDLDREIRTNLDQGDTEDVSFTFIVPQNAQNKLYNLELDADYDYNNGNYRQSSEETTRVGLKVIGCGAGGQTGGVTGGVTGGSLNDRIALISASLDSDARAGEQLVVKTDITGFIEPEADYVVRVTGFESWASLDTSQQLIHLRSGESKEVTLNFNVNQDASAQESFKIEVLSAGKIESREVEVNLENGGTSFNLGGNSLIWVIGIINVVLIILIIVVAVRISRK